MIRQSFLLTLAFVALAVEGCDSAEAILDDGITAAVQPGVTIELRGIRDAAEKSAWLPDGTVIPQPKDWPAAPRTDDDNPSHILTLKCIGLKDGQTFLWDKGYGDPITSPDFEAAPQEFSLYFGFEGRPNFFFCMGLTDLWGPWQRIEADGKLGDLQGIPTSHRHAYEHVSEVNVEATSFRKRPVTQVGLVGFGAALDVESAIVAVDRDGKQHTPIGTTKVSSTYATKSGEIFDLSGMQFDHFEFRLRPVTHWITFKNVALVPGKKSECVTVVQPVLDRLRPWRATGRVTNAHGKPLQGVKVRVTTGLTDRMDSGSGVTDAEGRYDFPFGVETLNGSTNLSLPTDYARITAHRDGLVEQNLSEHGKGVVSMKPLTEEDFENWGVTDDQVSLPNRPRVVDFVMIPPAQVSGTLVDEQDQPLQDYIVRLTREPYPGGESILSEVKTNEAGRFRIEGIPTTLPYQFSVSKPRRKPSLDDPWDGGWDQTWASPPINIELPGENDLVASNGKGRVTVKTLVLKIKGPGVFETTAVEWAQERAPGTREADLPIAGPQFVWELSNKDRKAAIESVPASSRKVSLNLNVQDVSREAALGILADQAGLKLEIDRLALSAIYYDLRQPVTLKFQDVELLKAALLVCDLPEGDWNAPAFLFHDDVMQVSTVKAENARDPDANEIFFETGLMTSQSSQTMETVDINDWKLTDDVLRSLPDDFTHAKSLRITLHGSATDEGLASLAKLETLESLEISGGEILEFRVAAVLADIKQLPKLRKLKLTHTGVTDAGIQHLADMPALEHLTIVDEGHLKDQAIETISQLSRLKSLTLTQRSDIPDHPLMQFGYGALSKLSQLQNLEALDVWLLPSSLPGKALDLPKLRTLSLRGNTIDDTVAAQIAKCSQLQTLALFETGISDAGLQMIVERTKLSSLSISGSSVTDAGIGSLSALPLSDISLQVAGLTDAALVHLAKVPTLEALRLSGSGTGMTIDGMRVLKDARRLTTLSLEGFPSQANYLILGELKQLRELHLEKSLTELRDLEALEAALPTTSIVAGTVEDRVGGPDRRRKKPSSHQEE